MDLTRGEPASLTANLGKTWIPNFIGVYWVGTDEEKRRAKQILINETGQTLADPADYLKWYRRHICHVEY